MNDLETVIFVDAARVKMSDIFGSCPSFHVSICWNSHSWSNSKACFWFGTISRTVIFHAEERETIGDTLEMEQKRVVCICLGFWCEPVAGLLAHKIWSLYEGFNPKGHLTLHVIHLYCTYFIQEVGNVIFLLKLIKFLLLIVHPPLKDEATVWNMPLCRFLL